MGAKTSAGVRADAGRVTAAHVFAASASTPIAVPTNPGPARSRASTAAGDPGPSSAWLAAASPYAGRAPDSPIRTATPTGPAADGANLAASIGAAAATVPIPSPTSGRKASPPASTSRLPPRAGPRQAVSRPAAAPRSATTTAIPLIV